MYKITFKGSEATLFADMDEQVVKDRLTKHGKVFITTLGTKIPVSNLAVTFDPNFD